MPFIIFAVLIVLIIGATVLIFATSGKRGAVKGVLSIAGKAALVLLITLTVFFGAFYIMLQ